MIKINSLKENRISSTFLRQVLYVIISGLTFLRNVNSRTQNPGVCVNDITLVILVICRKVF